jgi:hypothetical protein
VIAATDICEADIKRVSKEKAPDTISSTPALVAFVPAPRFTLSKQC